MSFSRMSATTAVCRWPNKVAPVRRRGGALLRGRHRRGPACPRPKAAMTPSTIFASFVLLFVLAADRPAEAQTYYEAPIGVQSGGPSGPMIPRTNLVLPRANSDRDRPTKELMNASPVGNDQKFLGMARAYKYECDPTDRSRCGQTLARMILWFSPKITVNIKLIFEHPWPRFHLLGRQGSPHWVGNGDPTWPGWNSNFAQVWNDLHISDNNLFMGFALPWPNDIESGQVMEVLIDPLPAPPGGGAPGRNRMWVIAE
jgi:hypothetical protein